MIAQQLEIEYKNLLTKEEFSTIKRYFSLTDDCFNQQVNDYFDTKHLELAARESALRIRRKKARYEMTLKQRKQVGMLESNDAIRASEAQAFLKNQQFPRSAETIKSALDRIGIKEDRFVWLGTLTTNRAELSYNDGLLVVDHSHYLGKDDYELEYEVNDEEKGRIVFSNLLDKLSIPKRETPTKFERFMLEKERQKARQSGKL